ncbi:hypothetical protein BGS_0061 [Beggiatoa sp. SS]|nr:hypothetical protein BGS_0061 [Beggiatoa sp. SS]
MSDGISHLLHHYRDNLSPGEGRNVIRTLLAPCMTKANSPDSPQLFFQSFSRIPVFRCLFYVNPVGFFSFILGFSRMGFVIPLLVLYQGPPVFLQFENQY